MQQGGLSLQPAPDPLSRHIQLASPPAGSPLGRGGAGRLQIFHQLAYARDSAQLWERRLPLRAGSSPAAPRGRLCSPAHLRSAPLAPLTIGRLGPLRLALLAALSSRRPRGPPPSPSAAGLGRSPPPRAMGCRGPRLGGEWRAAEAGCANPPPPSPRSPPPSGPWLPRRPAPSPPGRPLSPLPRAPPALHERSALWPP